MTVQEITLVFKNLSGEECERIEGLLGEKEGIIYTSSHAGERRVITRIDNSRVSAKEIFDILSKNGFRVMEKNVVEIN